MKITDSMCTGDEGNVICGPLPHCVYMEMGGGRNANRTATWKLGEGVMRIEQPDTMSAAQNEFAGLCGTKEARWTELLLEWCVGQLVDHIWKLY